MQNSIWSGFEVFTNTLVPLALAFGACLVRVAKYGWKGIGHFIQDYIIGAFVGILVFWGLDYFDFPPTVDAAITGGTAFVGKEALDAWSSRLLGWFGDWQGNKK